MKYVPQVKDVITLVNSDKTTKSYTVQTVVNDELCTVSDCIPVAICRNTQNDLIYNVIALDVLFNVYDIKRNNEFVVNNHDVFLYVKES